MKKPLAKAVSLIMTALFVFSFAAYAAPLSYRGAALRPDDIIEHYDPHDLEKAAAFLEQTDSSGVKNGFKLSPVYEPEDPGTWNIGSEEDPHFVWTEVGGVLKLQRFSCPSVQGGLFGTLDLSGCTALEYVDFSDSSVASARFGGCALLDSVKCKNNQLRSLSFTGCPVLRLLNCANNMIAALDVSGCPELRFLECRWNRITCLDVSSCPALTVLICTDNRLKTLDLRSNPLLGGVKFLRMADSGNKYVSCFFAADPEYTNSPEYFVSADCYESCSEYNGWYTDDGRPVTGNTTFVPQPGESGSYVARFTLSGSAPGDANSDGTVDVSDALMILRAAMSLISGSSGAGFDVNADGEISMNDALLILRRSMGLYGAPAAECF